MRLPPASSNGATNTRASSICAGVGKGGGKRLAALEEETGDAAAAELGERGLDAVGDKDFGARLAQGRGVGFWRDDDEHRRPVEGLEQLGIEREPGLAVEDNANRLPQRSRSGALYVP